MAPGRTAQLPDISNQMGHTTQVQCMATARPQERRLRSMGVRREFAKADWAGISGGACLG